jgi:D-alanyl-D-alanine carboxypeptidase (penicillin-binding protein 5/6)
MGPWQLVATVVSTALVAAPVAPASPVPSQNPAPLPCPYVTTPTIPPTPASPARDPGAPVLGGPQLGTAGLAVPPGTAAPPTLSAVSWVVADLDTGAVLGACDPHLQRRPASVQKLLLADTALPKLDPNQVVDATAEDVALPPDSSAVGLLVGGHYPVSTLWYGLLLESGNDAANALARVAGGADGLPGTVAAMNAEAHRLGADDTHAVTPSGLDADGQFTSAYDLALIARACFAVPDFGKYALTRSAKMPAQKKPKAGGFQFQNENKLIFQYKGALGGKTGFTQLARHSYVGGAQRNGRRLVVTLLGAEASPLRGYQQGEALLDWGFSLPKDASVGRLVAPGEADKILAEARADASAAAQAAVAARTGELAGVPTARTGVMVVMGVAVVAFFVIWFFILRAARRRRFRHAS